MSEHLFGDDNNKQPEVASEEVKKDFQGLIGSIRKFLSELLEIRSNTDPVATKESIIADIPFRGHTTWILICSIFIASIGLNANSTAVVIGAMLISPLMGPILGMGLSLAVNDIDLMRRSVKNFIVMVVISVLTAFLFFYLFPLRDESSELLARTQPDIRDVLIAFFGGLALVVARAKKGTIASVIFGVAIATALMPPLCTVGFGLAIGNYGYAGGAMYLFTINTIFIALATYLVIKFLRFPMVRYANSKRRTLIARLVSLVGLVVMIPAGWIFYNALLESRFEREAQTFLSETIGKYKFQENGKFKREDTRYYYNKDSISYIDITILGNEKIADNVIQGWLEEMKSYSMLDGANIYGLRGGTSNVEQELENYKELYSTNKDLLANKDEKIRFLEEKVVGLSQRVSKQIPFEQVSKEVKANFENVEAMGFAYRVQTDFKSLDTVPVFDVKWKDAIKQEYVEKEKKKLTNVLKVRLQDSTLIVNQVR